MLHNREYPSPGSLSNVKKSALLSRENISKKNGEISKNYISLFGGKPARRLPTPLPTSTRAVTAHFPRVGRQVRTPSARFTCENHSQEGGGGGGVICETLAFNNGSSDRLQTQNQDSQHYYAPLLFRQDLSNFYWWLMANFGELI